MAPVTFARYGSLSSRRNRRDRPACSRGRKSPTRKEYRTILTSSLALGAVRCRVKHRQRHRRAGNRASKNPYWAPTVCSEREGHTAGDANASSTQARRSPRAMSTSENCTRENRETSLASGGQPAHRIGTGSQKHNPGMNVSEESNRGVVPAKQPNKTRRRAGGGGCGGKAPDQGEHQAI